ncbi:hypothetical protein GCM10017750_00380 [Streptomyces racemochromogenes]
MELPRRPEWRDPAVGVSSGRRGGTSAVMTVMLLFLLPAGLALVFLATAEPRHTGRHRQD